MPYTVHTPDGQAHTYPDTATLYVEDDRSLCVHDDVEMVPGAWPLQLYPNPIVVYPAGQWTHYHVEPATYETDYIHTDEEHHEDEGQPTAPAEGKDKWQAEFQRHLNAGRKAAEAQ